MDNATGNEKIRPLKNQLCIRRELGEGESAAALAKELQQQRGVQFLDGLTPAARNPALCAVFDDALGNFGLCRSVGRLMWGPRGKLVVPFPDAITKDRDALTMAASIAFQDLRKIRPLYIHRFTDKARQTQRFSGLERYILVCRALSEGEASLWRAEQAGDFTLWASELILGSSVELPGQ